MTVVKNCFTCRFGIEEKTACNVFGWCTLGCKYNWIKKSEYQFYNGCYRWEPK